MPIIPFEKTGLPEEYRLEYQNNPYNRTARGGFLGIGRRKEQQELDLERDKYIENLYARYHDETYNSEAAKVERLRLAGLNPDLQGIQSASETSSQPLSQSDIGFSDPVQQVSDMSNMLLNLVSIGLSVPHGIADLKGQRLANDAQSIANAMNVSGMAGSHVNDFLPVDFTVSDEDKGDSELLTAAMVTSSRAEDLAKMYWPGKSKREARIRDQFIKAYKMSQGTTKTKLAEKVWRHNLNKADSENENDPVVNETMKVYNQYQLESAKNELWLQQQLDDFYSKHKDEYQQYLDEDLKSKLNSAMEGSSVSAYNMGVFNGSTGRSEGLAKGEEAIVREYMAKQRQADLAALQTLSDWFEKNGGFDPHFTWYIFHPEKASQHRYNKGQYNYLYQRVYGGQVYDPKHSGNELLGGVVKHALKF